MSWVSFLPLEIIQEIESHQRQNRPHRQASCRIREEDIMSSAHSRERATQWRMSLVCGLCNNPISVGEKFVKDMGLYYHAECNEYRVDKKMVI